MALATGSGAQAPGNRAGSVKVIPVVSSADKFTGLGRVATPAEVAAWDIDVRPDFRGLPPGSGSVAKGQDVWEAKCASCHGVFGESNEVFSPLVGGTTAKDITNGRVASLKDNSFPGRTTFMKLSTVSTLWDYINRAMPWTQPKSLTVEEVYAVTAYLLNLGGVVADDFVLSNQTIAQAQARLPNRSGMMTQHALWPGREFGGKAIAETAGAPCMSNCALEPKVASSIPEHARDAHGNLAAQNRLVGAQRGVDTTRSNAVAPDIAPSVAAVNQAAIALANKYSCTACHGANQKIVGPAFSDVAKKYAGQGDYLAEKIVNGSSGIWGPVPMPAQAISSAEVKVLADWLAAGAQR
jgi:S-disulfanyl-L-cysteine oxidoreductase SoxD